MFRMLSSNNSRFKFIFYTFPSLLVLLVTPRFVQLKLQIRLTMAPQSWVLCNWLVQPWRTRRFCKMNLGREQEVYNDLREWKCRYWQLHSTGNNIHSNFYFLSPPWSCALDMTQILNRHKTHYHHHRNEVKTGLTECAIKMIHTVISP